MANDNISVPKWFLESLENTLRIQYNIDKVSPETCQTRNIKGSLSGIRKLLAGEELSGMERLEKVKKEISPFLYTEVGSRTQNHPTLLMARLQTFEIIIGNIKHKLVDTPVDDPCEACSLHRVCGKITETLCIVPELTLNGFEAYWHFEDEIIP